MLGIKKNPTLLYKLKVPCCLVIERHHYKNKLCAKHKQEHNMILVQNEIFLAHQEFRL